MTTVTNGSVANLEFRKKYIPWLKDIGEECLTANDAYGVVEAVDEKGFLEHYFSLSTSITKVYSILEKLT